MADNTLKGVIIGGVIGLGGALIGGVFALLNGWRQRIHERQLRYDDHRASAYVGFLISARDFFQTIGNDEEDEVIGSRFFNAQLEAELYAGKRVKEAMEVYIVTLNELQSISPSERQTEAPNIAVIQMQEKLTDAMIAERKDRVT